GGGRKNLPFGARGTHLRQHRRHRGRVGTAATECGRSGRRPPNGCLHLGVGIGIQFLSAAHRARARRRAPADRPEPTMSWTRRRVLLAGGALTGVSMAGLLADPARGRFIGFKNLHTDERLEVEYFRNGGYVPEAFSAIEGCLRDFRTGERHAIDAHLMDYLTDVARALGVDPSFSVISGYRSPRTNAALRERSSGVAQHSLHMDGRAIDVRLAGVDCARLAGHALDLRRGGVGYYRASDFVHLDAGAFRTWRG